MDRVGQAHDILYQIYMTNQSYKQALIHRNASLAINDSILFIYWAPLFLDHYLHERYEDAVKVARKYGMLRVWFTQAYLAAAYGQLKNSEK